LLCCIVCVVPTTTSHPRRAECSNIKSHATDHY